MRKVELFKRAIKFHNDHKDVIMVYKYNNTYVVSTRINNQVKRQFSNILHNATQMFLIEKYRYFN